MPSMARWSSSPPRPEYSMVGINLQNPRLVLDQATRLARAGKLDEALSLTGHLPASPVKFQFQIDLLKNRNRQGDYQQVSEICVQWQRLAPGSVEPVFQEMQLYWGINRAGLTLPLANKIAELEPDHQYTAYYQAISQQLNGDFQNAIVNHRRALVRNSRRTFSELELDLEVAIAAYEIAAGHFPGSPGLNEDSLVEDQATFEHLKQATQRWLDSDPDISSLSADQVTRYGNACYNLGCVEASRYLGVGRALQHFRDTLRVNPAHMLARTNFLFVKNYDPEMSNQRALQLHLDTAAQLRRRSGSPRSSWKNVPDPERNLRIGYLSSDFCRHSVAHFITPVLESHDRKSLEVNAYYSGRRQDEWSERIAASVDQFAAVGTMNGQELHQKIVQDGIDILVDLNGYTQGHRLEVLLQRAAPIQVSWIGYPNTTGLDVMDYRIVDRITDPAPAAARNNSETLLYMDPVFSVYLPDVSLPDVAAELPASKAGHFTFGSFNALPKLNPELMHMWGRILARVEGSKLLIKNKMLDQPSVRKEVSQALTDVGIAPDRQILLGRTASPFDHMQSYQAVDLCLDSYPYNGTTTSCDALAMGVPVVTLAGSRHVSRVTASQLGSLDLSSLVATSAEQYVNIAVDMALNPEKLTAIHRNLRERMQKSALMDYQGFTRQLEQKYRDIWKHWCAEAVNMNPTQGNIL